MLTALMLTAQIAFVAYFTYLRFKREAAKKEIVLKLKLLQEEDVAIEVEQEYLAAFIEVEEEEKVEEEVE